MIETSTSWESAYPQAAIGILALAQVTNPASHAELDRQKELLESDLRAQFSGYSRQELRSLPSIEPYTAYYKRFKKTYHVLHQLESVVMKGKSIPRTAALVEAMFMAELKNQLLTAGHDFDALQDPLGITIASGDETYVGMGGRDLQTKADDMMITDAGGIISSILYGPDQRTRITPDTNRILFTVYAPSGIQRQLLEAHLNDLQTFVKVINPDAEVVEKAVLEAA